MSFLWININDNMFMKVDIWYQAFICIILVKAYSAKHCHVTMVYDVSSRKMI